MNRPHPHEPGPFSRRALARRLVLAVALVSTSACHLFSDGTINRTCEDLPGGCSGGDSPVVDTQDTGPVDPLDAIDWGRSAALGFLSGDTVLVQVYELPDVLVHEATFSVSTGAGTQDDTGAATALDSGDTGAITEAAPGPVTWDPDTETAYFVDNTTGTLYGSTGGEVETLWEHGEQSGDFHLDGSILYLTATTALASWDPNTDPSLDESLTDTTFRSLTSVFPAYEGNLYVIQYLEDSGTDLYRIDLEADTAILSYESFDEGTRTVDGFQGPDETACVCSAAGAIYAIASLAEDDLVPLAFPLTDELEELIGATVFSDVMDCAWDPSAELYLMLSEEHGVFAMDAEGRLHHLVDPEEPAFRGSFF